VEEDTRYVPAGAITIGVEYREFDAASLRKSYEGTKYLEVFEATVDPASNLDRAGVSLHVCDPADGQEYLRFDCFEDDPHYHYIHPSARDGEVDNHIVQFDSVAHGPMLPWALGRIRHQLPAMLAEAGGGHLVDKLDPAVIAEAVSQIEAIARGAASARAAAP
jgi:hypothetical protein